MKRTLTLILIAVAAGAHAQSITTIFTGGNSNSAGGGNYFQVTVAGTALTVTGFDVNTTAAAGTVFGFEVYTTPNTHVGNELNSAVWALQATGSGTSAGLNLPTAISMSNSFNLNAGTSYGMAIFLRGGQGPASLSYTNGNGANQFFSNADVSLTLGTATNAFFGPSVFNPRVWNGTMHYTPVPEPASMAALGLGLAAIVARRRRSKKSS
ncbi:MAG: PEP-CTERM sorting domain-containing protein [Fimbriimonadaceae bacterium]